MNIFKPISDRETQRLTICSVSFLFPLGLGLGLGLGMGMVFGFFFDGRSGPADNTYRRKLETKEGEQYDSPMIQYHLISQ